MCCALAIGQMYTSESDRFSEGRRSSISWESIVHACTMIIEHACTIIMVHACTTTIVHAYTMIIIHACTMIIIHTCTMNIVHACTSIIVQACTMITVHACTMIIVHARTMIIVHGHVHVLWSEAWRRGNPGGWSPEEKQQVLEGCYSPPPNTVITLHNYWQKWLSYFFMIASSITKSTMFQNWLCKVWSYPI